ncbi:MAG: hypothetical protein Q8P26_03710 [Candidatus Levybacteria bacterium]|nr:hypothetical protein [Candidatus Levybacteria bacterium]
MENFSAETDQPKKPEFQVKLGRPVFDYISNSLSPIYAGYKKELDFIQRDGSYRIVKDFRNTRFEGLMSRIKRIEENSDQNKNLKKVEMTLSADEMKIIEDKIPRPFDAANALIRREMMRDLQDAFNSAKRSSRT